MSCGNRPQNRGSASETPFKERAGLVYSLFDSPPSWEPKAPQTPNLLFPEITQVAVLSPESIVSPVNATLPSAKALKTPPG